MWNKIYVSETHDAKNSWMRMTWNDALMIILQKLKPEEADSVGLVGSMVPVVRSGG